MQPLAYRIKDFAALVAIGQTTIFKTIKSGELRCVKIRVEGNLVWLIGA